MRKVFGNPKDRGYPRTHASGGGVPVGIGLVDNNGDPSSSVKHSPPGKGKVPHEEGARGFADGETDDRRPEESRGKQMKAIPGCRKEN
ncbi:hypothetical protein LOK49_LG03G00528 [Camellia lanceoleosa]|uniref:Uncharacterized protein n=1 Tax=Camellia lanceoleosa TaxID=1840588 RepID=A0ACC0ICL8_9ERIC|nr:hypothetical protein LOK49_LG03G00528 [Camellia lanceoleosa]